MVRTPREDLERELRDMEYAKLYGAAQAKAEFAVTLARVRRGSEITQKELADRLGLSQPYIAKLEGGDANPTLGTVGSLLAVLDLRLVMHAEPLLSYSAAPTSVSGGPKAASAASGSLTHGEKRWADSNDIGFAIENQEIDKMVGANSQ